MTEPDDTRPVPFVDLALQHRRVAAEVRVRIDDVLDRAAFVLGPEVIEFEHAYARFVGVDHCVGVGNGTDALELALRAAGVSSGDDVIIPANTFVATAEAVLRTGASVVLADCGDDYLIDPASVADALTPATRAVVPVHLYGQIAPMKALGEAVGDDIIVIEDGAQSQGATQDGQGSGSFGVAAATSFYPGKNLGAYGDAGAVTTGSAEVAERVRMLRNHGGMKKYDHLVVGTNSRLDGLQAAVLSVKLRHLVEWNQERHAAAAYYHAILADIDGVDMPRTVLGNEHVWHLYVVRVRERDRVLAALTQAAIGAGIHYPAPIHMLPAFADLTLPYTSFPGAERSSAEVLSLPMFPGVTRQQQERVADCLRAALR